MDALFKSLVSMLKTALLKSKGRFDEEELRAVFAEHGMDVPSAKRFHRFVAGKPHRGGAQRELHQQRQEERLERAFVYRHQRVSTCFCPVIRSCSPSVSQATGATACCFYCTPFSDLNMLLNLLSMLDCLSFQRQEGRRYVFVHVRFDNPELLQQLKDSDEYHNLILDTNERIFEEQIELFSFFFGTDTLTNNQGRDFVEEYFTGNDAWRS